MWCPHPSQWQPFSFNRKPVCFMSSAFSNSTLSLAGMAGLQFWKLFLAACFVHSHIYFLFHRLHNHLSPNWVVQTLRLKLSSLFSRNLWSALGIRYLRCPRETTRIRTERRGEVGLPNPVEGRGELPSLSRSRKARGHQGAKRWRGPSGLRAHVMASSHGWKWLDWEL